MALTIKHLNTDASFQLTFRPITPASQSPSPPFHILLDPWITGPSKILHSRISLTHHKHPACITSLTQLPIPDLVIISQSKSDHCNEATLRQLPHDGPTLILADPAAARIIRSWRYFDPHKVRVLRRYDDGNAVVRLPLVDGGGERGEVSVAWIPQRRDLTGLHAAVGITFRSPLTPSIRGGGGGGSVVLATPPATPISPASTLRSARSLSTLTTLTPTLTNTSTLAAHPSSAQRTLSLLFSPHGMPFAGPLSLYATTHLVKEAALPLTALLHCFDSVSNPWWLGGNVLLGAPAGREIALRLGARVWVSCHDGAKDVKGLATAWLKTRRWDREDVQKDICEDDEEISVGMGTRGQRGQGTPAATTRPAMAPPMAKTTRRDSSVAERIRDKGTRVLDLASGEEVTLTSGGLWNEAGAQPMARKSWRGDAESGPSLVGENDPDFHTFDAIMASVPVARPGERCRS
ncbi:hypothetical protein N0V93_001335 [Gnomoniopsis smithogilvyi]|uniref:Uncharacterized protein n=1 Tax=Gnomoniopsis smithogilvyi TaxID=1191159 RepID=A0A9W8Z3B7_9PEZI|nr:hypothetical protein N0V93_001335 [Gnomoniopsis smithogilvyi]